MTAASTNPLLMTIKSRAASSVSGNTIGRQYKMLLGIMQYNASMVSKASSRYSFDVPSQARTVEALRVDILHLANLVRFL